MNRLRHLPHSAAVSTILPDISRQAKNGAQVVKSTFGSSSSGKPNELGVFFVPLSLWKNQHFVQLSCTMCPLDAQWIVI